ncbi:MAG: hypothetical protein V7K67_32895 [Nostoc sp.]|uniref:hypothetical protein n=1 Tax=Nostoc sp. TaxID=1180 RepID=UPI002FF9C583
MLDTFTSHGSSVRDLVFKRSPSAGRSIVALIQICFAVSNCNGNATQRRAGVKIFELNSLL